jgi:hypothetical protein
MAVSSVSTSQPTAEELRVKARELFDTLIVHCKYCTDCRIFEGRPVVKPGYCGRGGDLRSKYEDAYREWFPYSGRGQSRAS